MFFKDLRRRASERGNVLVISVVIVAVCIVSTGAMLTFVNARSQATNERGFQEDSVRGADAAVGIKLSQLLRLNDSNLFGTLNDGSKYAIICRRGASEDGRVELIKMTAVARNPPPPTGMSAANAAKWPLHWSSSELVIERKIAAAQSNFFGALMAYRNISFSGSPDVNGNNFLLDGTLAPTTAEFPDKLAIIGAQDVDFGGGAKACGMGDTVPRSNPRPGDDGNQDIIDANQNMMENAASNGIWLGTADNHFPTSPDQVLSSPDGTAKARAVKLGTYFTSEAQFSTWKGTLPGGIMPPNSLLYLDYNHTGADLDGGISSWGNTYHTVIQHFPRTRTVNAPKLGIFNATSTAYIDQNSDGVVDPFGTVNMDPTTGAGRSAPVWDGFGYVKTKPDGISTVKVPHVQYNGVLIVDNCSNMNSGAIVFGGVCFLAEDDGTVLNVMNGSSQIKFSSKSIDRAIAVNLFTGTSTNMVSYRELRQNMSYDAQLALAKIGVTIPDSVMPATPTDALDSTLNPKTRTLDGWQNNWGEDPANTARSNPANIPWVQDINSE